MQIPLVDLATQYDGLRSDLLPAIDEVLRRAHFILGSEVELFEEEFAEYCGAKHCVSLSSGTEALHLALRAAGVGPGHEVITAANTFVATGLAIKYTGATPVFVDVDPRDHNLDVGLLEEAITDRTKAIIPVHLYGQPARISDVLEIAHRHGLQVIQDACQAHGATYQGRRIGAFGNAAGYSFYPAKNLGAFGDGGAVVTNDAGLADELRLLRNYGQRAKNVHELLGYNSRLDTLQAAVLLFKLRRLDAWNERRREVARTYRRLLSGCEAELPAEFDDVQHVYHLYVIRHPDRDRLLQRLHASQIGCGIHYPTPLPHMPIFQDGRAVPDGVPVSTLLAKSILSLPVYPEITGDQVRRVADEVVAFAPQRMNV